MTQNGKAAAVMLAPEEFDRLTAQARFVAAVQEGLSDVNAGRVMNDDDLGVLASGVVRRSAGSTRRTRGILGGRSDQVVRRVLDAAIVELGRAGYASFRVKGVAALAGVNKTTIYRRWPSREALVAAVVGRMRAPLHESPLPDTGRLERDLGEAFARRSSFGRKKEGRAWARLLEERHDPTTSRREREPVSGAVPPWRWCSGA